MPDRKLTDSKKIAKWQKEKLGDKNYNEIQEKAKHDTEIKKALDVCGHTKGCTNCPLGMGEMDNCQLVLTEDALDLINRLQAENERLKPFEDKIAEFNSHIRVEDMLVFADSLAEWLEFCDNLKAEARKEFAERLKLHSYIMSDESQTGIINRYSVVTVNQIDNLLKEMVGEDK